jgi:pimeloyl-ACP methyl ester carboxylesterase
MLRSLFPVTVLAVACTGSTPASKQPHIDVDGPQLWVQVAGQGEPTVVFEAGEADDSSVWAGVEAKVRLPNGVRTVLYDRAGLGKSTPSAAPYRIDDEATALKRALDRFAIKGPIVVVAHSYGGFVAMMLAASDARVAGVVLVDAFVPEMFDDAAAARFAARYPQLEALERTKPGLARAVRAFPETARRMRSVAYPAGLPTIDIVAERAEADSVAHQAAHAAFVAASPEREAVIATGSGHYVMRDRPDLVDDAIARIIRRARSK